MVITPNHHCMKKVFALLFAAMFWICISQAQQKDSIPINKDSIEKAVDEFLALLDSANKPKSYWLVAMGFSNQQFSINNLALNAQQSTSNFSVIPQISYYDRSGFSITYNNFLAFAGSNTGIVQHVITPAFDYSRNKAFDFGFSYSRFIGNKNFGESTSPYKNDFYSYLEYNNWNIKPSIAPGYSTGNFTTTSRTDTFAVVQRPFRPDTTIRYTVFDTLNVKLRDFSTVVTARHEWMFDTKKKDNYITFTPSLLWFFVRSAYDAEYTSASVLSPRTRQFLQNNPQLRDRFLQQLKSNYPGLNQTRNFLENTPFSLQSIGLNLDAVFYFKKFYINPQVYLDYYLKADTDNFSALYTLQAGFMF